LHQRKNGFVKGREIIDSEAVEISHLQAQIQDLRYMLEQKSCDQNDLENELIEIKEARDQMMHHSDELMEMMT